MAQDLAIFVKSHINFWPQIAQNCQIPEVVDFSTTKCGFSQKWPNLDYFTGDFGVLEQFLAKPHLVARQNRTIWRFGKNMSDLAYYWPILHLIHYLPTGNPTYHTGTSSSTLCISLSRLKLTEFFFLNFFLNVKIKIVLDSKFYTSTIYLIKSMQSGWLVDKILFFFMM